MTSSANFQAILRRTCVHDMDGLAETSSWNFGDGCTLTSVEYEKMKKKSAQSTNGGHAKGANTSLFARLGLRRELVRPREAEFGMMGLQM